MVDTNPRIPDRSSAVALLVAALGGLLTMAFHPTAEGIRTSADPSRALWGNQAVHVLGIVSVLAMLHGTVGLTHALFGHRPGLVRTNLIAAGAAAAFGSLAAIASGFVGSSLLASGDRDSAAWRANAATNQACAALFVAAFAATVVVSSWFGRGRLPRWLGAFGVGSSVLLLGALLIGHLRLGVHGFGLVVVAQSVWMFGAAHALWRGSLRS